MARFGLLFATGLGAIAAVVSVDRVGKGIRTAPRDAMIHAETAQEHLGRAFGTHRAMDTAGAALGPLLAFTVLWLVPDGYGTVLAMSLGFAVVGVAVLGLLVPASTGGRPRVDPVERQAGRPAVATARWRDLTTPALRRLLAVAGILGLLTVGDGFVYLALLDSGAFATQWFPVLYVGTNLAYLALALPLGRLADRAGRGRVLLLGHLALAAAYVCAAVPFLGATTTVLALVLLGTFYAATDGVLAALAGHLVPVGVRATGIATAQTVVALARMAATAGFGVLWWQVGPRAALLVMAGALVVAVPPALVTLARVRPRAEVS